MSSPNKNRSSARQRRTNLSLDLEHANGDESGPSTGSSAKPPFSSAANSPFVLAFVPEEEEEEEERDGEDQVNKPVMGGGDYDEDANSQRWSVGFVVTYGLFFFAGAASIAMWSAITLCLDFFTQKYPDQRVGFVFPVVNMSSLLVISLYMVLAGRQLPLEPRVHGALAVYLVFVVALPLVNMASGLNRHVAYTLTLLSLMGATVSSSVLQSTMYGLGGVFGPIFMQALDGGKGFGAMLLFAFRLAFKWYFQGGAVAADVENPRPNWRNQQQQQQDEQLYAAKLSMGVFFGVAFSMVVMTWILFVAMKYTTYAQPLLNEYVLLQDHSAPFAAPVCFSPMATTPLAGSPQRRRVFRFPSATATERSPLLMQRSSIEWDSEASTIERVARENSRSTEADLLEENENGESFEEMEDLEKPRSPPPHSFLSLDAGEPSPSPVRSPLSPAPLLSPSSSGVLLDVFRTAAKPFCTLFLSYFVCLSCFPGIISAISSTTWRLGDWFPILLVGCFNGGDLLGKNLPMRVMYFDITTLHRPWALQLAFVPFFVVALLRPLSDLLVISMTLALGLLTGYVATSAMILAPSVCREHEKEVAGMIASLCAIVGLCAGSYNGLALETLVQLWRGDA